ncbi:hypothetical protein NKG05_30910 [Oerskovia sp. M15]
MNDDDFVRRLRSMEAPTPQIRIDTATVLRSGRRRRLARATGTTLGIGALCAGLYAGAAAVAPGHVDREPIRPATTDRSPTEEPVPAMTHAVIDEVAGTITTPLDQWLLSSEEMSAIETAGAVYVARCMTDVGFGDLVELVGPVPVENQDGYNFGLWRHEALERGDPTPSRFCRPRTASMRRTRSHRRSCVPAMTRR